jgi:predicted NBD/HSP70 family sugar kinase
MIFGVVYQAPVMSPLQRQILSVAMRSGPLPRGDLATRLSSSRSRLSPEISQMLDLGVLRLGGLDESRGGRRGSLLIPGGADVGVLAGIDIDADRATVAVTTLDGTIIATEVAPITGDPEPRAVLGRTAKMLERCLPGDLGPLLSIGVSIPADIDPVTGLVESAPTMPRWLQLATAKFYAARFGVRTFVDNDVNVLALAEASCPGGDAHGRAFLVVKISSGVGCGIVVDGVVFRGSYGYAGDIGHISADPANLTLCACGNHGCLEALAAAPAIIRAANNLGAVAESSSESPPAGGPPLTMELIGRAAESGDARLAQLLREVGGHIGLVLAGLVSFFNPSCVIVTSGLAGGEGILLNAIRERIYGRTLPASSRDLKVLSSRFSGNAGGFGAAILAAQGFVGTAGPVPEARPPRR